MILSSHGILSSSISSGSAFDADYQAVLNYATLQGYTLPSAGQQIKQNQLVLDLKSGGIWSKLDSFAVFANDGSANYGLIDWKRLSDYTAVNSPTFTSNQGFAGNGTSSYIDTNFNLNLNGINYTLNSASRYHFHYSGSSFFDGTTVGGFVNSMRNTLTTANNINSSALLTTSFEYTTVKGVKSIHRTSSLSVQCYNDKSTSILTQSPSLLLNTNQLILRRSTLYSTNLVSAYALGASLVSENDDFVDALTNYINAL